MTGLEIAKLFLLVFICAGVFAVGCVLDNIRDILREIKREIKKGG